MKSTVSLLAAGAVMLSSTVAALAGSPAPAQPEYEPVVVIAPVGSSGSLGGYAPLIGGAAAIGLILLIASDDDDDTTTTSTPSATE